MAFSPEYVRLVLRENFEDAQALLLDPLMAIHEAHLAMLAECALITRADALALRAALAGIDRTAVAAAQYDPSVEDLFYYVDRLIAGACGPDVAGRLHTARSRNDIDMTMYRMRLREAVLDLGRAVASLRETLIAIGRAHLETVFPAHTHGQPAQPTTLAHYLLAVIEQLERDETRLFAAYETTNRCPLGACAITGTGFAIDRDRTASLLGYAGPTGNTYGSIATVDYLLECAGAGGVVAIGVGRFVQDLLLWSTREMGYLRLSDAFVQQSSIMPQKRNPVALEHARALLSKAAAELHGVAAVVHNTPFGDVVDTEDDLQPLVARAFRDASRAVTLLAPALAEATFDVPLMRARAAGEWVTATELADTIVREAGVPFSRAHAIAAALARQGTAPGSAAAMAEALAASAREQGVSLDWTPERLAQVLSAEHFIAVRRTLGGPAPAVAAGALAAAADRLAADRSRLEASARALADAAARRQAALAALG